MHSPSDNCYRASCSQLASRVYAKRWLVDQVVVDRVGTPGLRYYSWVGLSDPNHSLEICTESDCELAHMRLDVTAITAHDAFVSVLATAKANNQTALESSTPFASQWRSTSIAAISLPHHACWSRETTGASPDGLLAHESPRHREARVPARQSRLSTSWLILRIPSHCRWQDSCVSSGSLETVPGGSIPMYWVAEFVVFINWWEMNDEEKMDAIVTVEASAPRDSATFDEDEPDTEDEAHENEEHKKEDWTQRSTRFSIENPRPPCWGDMAPRPDRNPVSPVLGSSPW